MTWPPGVGISVGSAERSVYTACDRQNALVLVGLVTLFAPAYVALTLVGAALATFARFDRPPLSP